jgi:hypothetical protein
MKKIMFLSVMMILGLTYLAESGEGLGFRDIYLGMDAEQASYMAEKCREESDDIDGMKINDYLIPNVTSQRRPVEGEKVERIVVCFTPKSSEAIIKAIREKYGKPFFHENISYQNAFGATLVGFQEAWNWKGGVAMLSLMPDPIYGWPHMFAQYDIRTKAYDDKSQTELKKKPKL